MSFCPKCGKTIPKGETFCEEHSPKAITLKPFDIRVCACERYFAGNRWTIINNLEESILKTAKDHIKERASLKITQLILPEKRGRKTIGKITATYEDKEYPIEFHVKQQRCDKCAKMGSHYFTAILQLRDPPEGVLEFIESYLAPQAEKGVSVNKIEDTPRGPDLYMTHKAVARQLAEKLVRKYGGIMKQSEQLFSRNHQTSKNLYRLNVLVQFSTFRTGDVILLEGIPVLVTGQGKQCTGRNLVEDKKVIFTAGKEEKVLAKHKTTVATTHPHLEVIHPETFQSTKVHNHKNLLPDLEDGQPITVVITKNKVYCI